MEAIITIVIKDVENWGDYENHTIPEMENDVKEVIQEALDSGIVGFDNIKVDIE